MVFRLLFGRFCFVEGELVTPDSSAFHSTARANKRVKRASVVNKLILLLCATLGTRGLSCAVYGVGHVSVVTWPTPETAQENFQEQMDRRCTWLKFFVFVYYCRYILSLQNAVGQRLVNSYVMLHDQVFSAHSYSGVLEARSFSDLPLRWLLTTLTESEVVTGKSQIESSPYSPSDSDDNTAGRGLRFSCNDRTVEVIKFFYYMAHQN